MIFCHFCSKELMRLSADDTLMCVPCTNYSNCGVIYYMNGDNIKHISISYLETIKANIDPRYLGPADDFEFQYYLDQFYYRAKIYLDNNTIEIYKVQVNVKNLFTTNGTPVITLSDVNLLTPYNMKAFIKKLSLYATFS